MILIQYWHNLNIIDIFYILAQLIKMEQQKQMIIVSDPQLSQAGGFTTYQITGTDGNAQFSIRRRFNDFYYLRECLQKKWPGFYIPPIPSKKTVGNKEFSEVQHRRRFFQIFLNRLQKIKLLYSDELTTNFLKEKDIQMQKVYQKFEIKPENVIQRYKSYSEQIGISKSGEQNLSVMINFKAFLKKTIPKLKEIRNDLTTIIESRNAFIYYLNKFTYDVFPEYQKNIYSEYLPEQNKENGLIFAGDANIQDKCINFKDNNIKENNPFWSFHEYISYQTRQMEAMLQAIESCESYQAKKKQLSQKMNTDQSQLKKLQEGRLTIKSLFSKGSKQTQLTNLQKNIPTIKQSIQQHQKAFYEIYMIVGQQQIPIFKRQKQLQYEQVMQKVTKEELRYYGFYSELMKSIKEKLEA